VKIGSAREEFMDKNYFFHKYGIEAEAFNNSGLVWEDLIKIYDDYTKRLSTYEDTAKYIADCLNRENAIHSIKYRIKDSERLLEKIVRKALAGSSVIITVKNYRQKIRDLIGLRALHLFKEEWTSIHDFLYDNWEFHSAPKANHKKGDPEELLESYTKRGLTLIEHAHGYRSLHYNIKIKPGRHEMIAEVQLRTLFEEAWSEIDHHLRYSSNKEIDYAEPYLGVLNNLTSNADEIASHVRRLYMVKSAEHTDDTAVSGVEDSVQDGAGKSLAGESGHIKVRDIYKSVKMKNQYS
jgi:ppGpp synthetase/RelA/SpoT-type nucleotidyltranferase